jgi:hypothetical protein
MPRLSPFIFQFLLAVSQAPFTHREKPQAAL